MATSLSRPLPAPAFFKASAPQFVACEGLAFASRADFQERPIGLDVRARLDRAQCRHEMETEGALQRQSAIRPLFDPAAGIRTGAGKSCRRDEMNVPPIEP
jgi:hypothetical protein